MVLPENRTKLEPGVTLVTTEMVTALELLIDDANTRFEAPAEFTVPGQTEVSARLDWARVIVRRAERASLAAHLPDSQVLPYLNRLSDLLWTLARWQEGQSLLSRES